MNRARLLPCLVVISLFALFFNGCSGGSKPIVLAFNFSGAQTIDNGQSLNITVTGAGGKGVTWSLGSAGTLSNKTTTSVTYNAPASVTAPVTDHVIATSVDDSTKTLTLAITNNPTPKITTTTLPADMEGTAYNQTVAASGGAGTLAFSITGAGTLPAGLTMSSAGVITGTPTGPNTTSSFTVKVTDSSTANTGTNMGPQSATQALSITINLPTPPSITTTSLPDATQGAAYNQTVAATAGLTPYTFTIVVPGTGTLPAGLTMSAAGVISGTPTGSLGTSSFTVKVTDSSNPTQSATQSLSIKVDPAPVVITTTSLPNGFVSQTGYSATLASTGGAPPVNWSITAGALPPGLILAVGSSGQISGMPNSPGTFPFTVTATDSSTTALTASKNLSITIIPQLKITTNSLLPNGITNTAYTGVTLASTGGSGAVVWTLTSGTTLPPNLALNASTGAITGTPTTAGTFTFTVQAADSGTPQQKVTMAFTITIIQQLVITTPAALPTGTVGSPYNVQLASSGGTGAVTWAVASGSTLPGGLNLSANGLLSGVPTTANTYHFSITATDSGTPQQTATVAFTLTITPVLAITTTQAQIPSGTVGTAYSTTIMSNNGGIAPYTWLWSAQNGSSLPPGLNINSSTGVISGTPTTAGTYNVFVRVFDSEAPATESASAPFSISIATAPLSVASTSLPNAIVGQAYNQTLASAGGNPPVTWSISAGALPTWATLNATTGAITGTPPNATGSPFSFTVKATDSSTPTVQTATKALSITVVAALSITTTSLPNGTVGSPYTTTVAATGGTTPYTWSWAPQAGSSLPPGLSIASGTGVISGTPGGSGGAFNVTVTVADSATNPQQTASAPFTITITVATLTVTTTSGQLPTGTVSSAYPNTQLSASGGIPSYSWSQTAGTLPPGLILNSSGQITGTPTTATGSPFSFTVQVTDSAVPPHTATATLSITVNAANNNALLNGDFAFQFTGFVDAGGEVAIVGRFHADGNGNLTGGALDTNAPSSVAHSTFTGTYTVTGDRRCTLVAGTITFKCVLFATASGTQVGRIIRFDDSSGTGTRGSGELHVQTLADATFSVFNGDFAMGFVGDITVNTSSGPANGRLGVVGRVTVGTNGVFSAGTVDVSVPGTSFSSTFPGSLNTPDSASGHGTGSFTVTTPVGPILIHFAYYIVGKHKAFTVTTDTRALNVPLLSGFVEAQRQASFTAASITGPLVFALAGECGSPNTSTSPASVVVGQAVANGSGMLTSGMFDQNECGAINSMIPLTGTYTADSTVKGRFTITLVINPTNAKPLMMYLTDINKGFLLEGTATTPGSEVAFGIINPQTAPTTGFSEANLAGTYAAGTILPATSAVPNISGVATLTSSVTPPSTLSGTMDVSLPPPGTTLLFHDASISGGTYALTDSTAGRFTATFTVAGVTFNFVIYQAVPGGFVAVEVTSGNAGSAGMFFQQ